ncbi:putative peptide modification system cyclase [Arenimonas fontis]|nr:putative peptide modification system cyclase [Arenimonas fontis]
MEATLTSTTAPPAGVPVTPVLRAVLLCDIVDSTAATERLGDQRWSALMQRHDRMLRDALRLCHGQLIDRADGVLALFERPIQALDFALRYQRGLRELGREEGVDLRARIGIHVGDVMMWANAPADVRAGAKPFEVEGLAKPVAARLMGLALPGQILMSGMAQNLAQRAVGELGEDTAARLRWLMHGRYRFKGVPAPMLVHEVGEVGLAPLRPPESGAKAWRELPLWRRPPMLAMEMLVVGALAVAGLWTALRAPPAIAFAERDWVVVADLQNRTDEPLFDDALDVALRVGLEQSRHVNIISELQVDRTLERMQRQGQPLDRQVASEVALREGARAVILPTVAEVGGRVRVSLEVIDPHSGVTVYSESADGVGVESVLPSLDTALTKVRGRLGETMSSIEANRIPLEQATTSNLEALKAFSMGVRMRYTGRAAEAQALFEEAVRLDPEFAMAWLRLAFMRYVEVDAEGTRAYLDKALAHSEHLTHRERLFLEGAEATLSDPRKAVERFGTLVALYPDDYRGRYNYAYFAHFDLLEGDRALEQLEGAIFSQNPAQASAAYLSGSIALSANQIDRAITLFEKAETLGVRGYARDFVEAYIAKRDYAEAARLQSLQTSSNVVAPDLEARLVEVSLPLDQGRYREALAAMQRLAEEAMARDRKLLARAYQLSVFSLRAYAPDETLGRDLEGWVKEVEAEFDQAQPWPARQLAFHLLGGAWVAAHTGNEPLAKHLVSKLESHFSIERYPANAAMLRIARAELALASGEPGKAVELLLPDHARNTGLYFSRAVLLRALLATRRDAEAALVADWLIENRGRALGEPTLLSAWQPANVVENGLAIRAAVEIARRQGLPDMVRTYEAAFAKAWPGDEALEVVKRRDAALD